MKGHVIGAAAHGFGAALLENLKYDESGNLLTTFSDYCPLATLNIAKRYEGAHLGSRYDAFLGISERPIRTIRDC